MKKRIMRFICVMAMAMLLAACSNTDSKVNQVIQNQIQEADKNVNQGENNDIPKVEVGLTNEDIKEKDTESQTSTQSNNVIDVDLTKLSSTMVYSEVYNMMYDPKSYIGKNVKMSGMFVVYTNQDESRFYPAVIIADATACCSQGLEFVLEGNPRYPEGYPEMEAEICVIGTFETYEEDGNLYCRLQNARIEQ